MRERKKNILILPLAIISIIVILAIVISNFRENRRETNLYNIGNLQDINQKMVLPSVAIFNEYILDNFEGIEIQSDNTVYRADSVIENTASVEALKKAERLLKIADNSSIKNLEYANVKDSIFNDDVNKIDINYFSNSNGNSNFYNKEKKYLENYVNYKSIKLDESGYLINYSDGYESLLNINDTSIDWEILTNINNVNLHPSLKFVDNKMYTVYAYIEDLSNIDKSNLLSSYITIEDIEYRSNFEGIDFINNGYLLKFTMFDGIEKLLTNRFTDITLTLNAENGYIIPKSSIIKKSEQDGVYFLDNNVITFTPVKIIKEEEDNYYISNNISTIFPEIVSEEEIEFKTLEPFSKILLNPENYEEGNIY